MSRQIPVRLNRSTLVHLHVAVFQQGLPACRGDVWNLRIYPDVIEYLPDISTVRDEGDDAHLPATDRAQQREQLADAGDERSPQAVNW